MYRDWNRGSDEGFTFLVADVSASPWYSLLQMLFVATVVSALAWCSLLQMLFWGANASATCFSLNLQMLFSLPIMYNCIYILPFLVFEDTLFANFASASHIFDNVRMLLIEIVHPQLALPMTCRYSPAKLCIHNLFFLCLADTPQQNYASYLLFPWLADASCRNFASSILENLLSQISSFNYPLRPIYFIDWANTWLTQKLI